MTDQVEETSDTLAVLTNVTVGWVDTSDAGATRRTAVLAGIGTLLTGSSVHKVAVAAGTGESDTVKDGAGHTCGALRRVSRFASDTVKGFAREALIGLGTVEIVARFAGASAVVGTVDESCLGVAVDANGRVDLNVKSCEGRAGSWAAACGGIIGIAVLSEVDVGPYILVGIN